MDVSASVATDTVPLTPYTSHSTFAIGLDIGQASDPTALAVVNAVRWEMSAAYEATYRHKSGAWLRSPGVAETVAQKPRDTLDVVGLRRLPLGTSYPEQCQMIASLLADPRLSGARVFLDRTGVGRGIGDLFRSAGIGHVAITITGGREVQDHGDDNISVPKLELISRLQAALHSRELRISKALPDAAAFARELTEFRATFTAAGSLTFGARVGCHDDLVLACALATWGATRPRMAMGVMNFEFAAK